MWRWELLDINSRKSAKTHEKAATTRCSKFEQRPPMWAKAYTLWLFQRDINLRSGFSGMCFCLSCLSFLLQSCKNNVNQSCGRWFAGSQRCPVSRKALGRHFRQKGVWHSFVTSLPRALPGRWQQLFVTESKKLQEECCKLPFILH